MSVGLDLSDYEPLLFDERVNRIRDDLIARVGRERFLAGNPELVTFVVPQREVNIEASGVVIPKVIPGKAVFAIVYDNPRSYPFTEWDERAGALVTRRRKAPRLMANATTNYTDFRAAEKERGHFAGVGDPAFSIFLGVTREYLTRFENLKELI